MQLEMITPVMNLHIQAGFNLAQVYVLRAAEIGEPVGIYRFKD